MFATGDGTLSTLRFNVIAEASEHDKPIVINALQLFQEIAGAKIGDYPDQASAFADTVVKQRKFYSLLSSLDDKETSDELDRVFQHWLNN